MINVKVREGLRISQQEQNDRKGEAQDRQAWTMVVQILSSRISTSITNWDDT